MVEEQLEERDAFFDDLKIQFLRAQEIMKLQADKHHREVIFDVGDWVYVKLHPYRQRSLATKRNEKLVARFYEPFQVLSKVGTVAYKLAISHTASIHPVFHVSQLCQATGATLSSPTIPSQLNKDLEMIIQPEAVLNVQQSNFNGNSHSEVLLQWKDATWEDFTTINTQFPDFHLEDKVKLWAIGNVRPPIHITYARRKSRAKL